MQGIDRYNKYICEIERVFIGQPYASILIIKSLIILADSSTGIVNNISYNELASLLTINPAPVRKNSGTPTKQTIRNYIKSIERECGEYFKVISEGQKLQFYFPELPKIFNKIFENQEVNTDFNISTTHKNIDGNVVFDDEANIELNTEVNTPTPNVEKLFININNKTNNNNLGEAVESKNLKQPISPTFYPSEKTIARAIASGYSFATDAHVIQEFIDKNIAWGSEFADFNPVYLSFLAKHEHFQQQRPALQNIQGQSRSTTDERTFIKRNSYDAALEQALRDNADAISPSDQHLLSSQQAILIEFKPTEHFLALGGADQNVRSIVC